MTQQPHSIMLTETFKTDKVFTTSMSIRNREVIFLMENPHHSHEKE